MNETWPLQKQDLDRVVGLLEAILKELRTISATCARPMVVMDQPHSLGLVIDKSPTGRSI